MKHLHGHHKLGRDSAHRRAMLGNLSTALITHERIETTLARAKALRSVVDRCVTWGKRGTLAARRRAAAFLHSREVVSKLFDDVAPRFKERQGGYTRIMRRGLRAGDGAQMAIIEFVDFKWEEPQEETKKSDS